MGAEFVGNITGVGLSHKLPDAPHITFSGIGTSKKQNGIKTVASAKDVFPRTVYFVDLVENGKETIDLVD